LEGARVGFLRSWREGGREEGGRGRKREKREDYIFISTY
jgi:hypothetical protein